MEMTDMTEKAKITTAQLFTLLFVCRISLTMIYSVYMSGVNGLWSFVLPLIISLPLSLVLLLPTMYFSSQNKDVSVCEYSVRNFKRGGKVISFFYAFYFFISAVYVIASMLGFMSQAVPEGLSVRLLLLLIIAGCIYSCTKGIEAVSRMSAIVTALIVIASILTAVYLLSGYSSSKLLPLNDLSLLGTADCIIFIISRMNSSAAVNILSSNTKGRFHRGLIIWSVLTLVFMLIMLLIIRGSTDSYLDIREFQVYNALEGSGVLQRLDPFFILVIVCSIFCNITLLMLSCVQCLRTAVPKIRNVSASVFVGSALMLSAAFLPYDGIGYAIFNKYFWFILAVVFTFLLPCAAVFHYRYAHKKPVRNKARRVVRTASITIIMTLALLMFTGCSSRQLSQCILVQGIGIDSTENGLAITLITLDTDDRENDNNTKLILTNGKSVQEAFTDLENQRGRKLVLDQCLFIIMDEMTANNNKSILPYFVNSNSIPKSTNLMVSSEPASLTIASAMNDMGYTSEEINVLADSKEIKQSEIHCSLLKYASTQTYGTEAVLFPYIITDRKINALSVEGSYLTNSNTKPVYLTEEETLAVMILNSELYDYHESIPYQNSKAELEIAKAESKIVPTINNDELTLTFISEINVVGNYTADETAFIRSELYKRIEDCTDKIIHQSGSDIFFINKNLNNTNKDKNKPIDISTIKNADINITVNIV